MSISAVAVIMGRIKSATELSPIVVLHPKPNTDYPTGLGGKLDAAFARTIESEHLIRSSKRLVGIFHNSMDVAHVKARLFRAAQQGE